jgi:hypothetical protein
MQPWWKETSMIRSIIYGEVIAGINKETKNPEWTKIHTDDHLKGFWNLSAGLVFGYTSFIPYFTDRRNGSPIARNPHGIPPDIFKEDPKVIWRTKPAVNTTTLVIHGK